MGILKEQTATLSEEEMLLTIEQTAKILGVSKRTVIRYYQADGLPVIHLPGNTTRFRRKDVKEFYERYRTVGHRRASKK